MSKKIKINFSHVHVITTFAAAALFVLAWSCNGDGNGEEDADAVTDADGDLSPEAVDGEEPVDVEQEDTAFDAVEVEDGADSEDMGEEETEHPPEVILCEDIEPPGEGTCEVAEGGDALLIRGNILAPESVLVGGQVLVSDEGIILCVGCDCSSEPEASGATVLTCGQGVVSPGLINAHDHLTYTQNVPGEWGEERYDHRHDWRRGLRGHTRIPYLSGASTNQIQWGELRQVMSGTTSIAGSGGSYGFLRNVDRGAMQEGLYQDEVEYQTFPLGDSNGTLLTSSCNYPGIDSPSVLENDCYLPHVSEGIDNEARNEFLCLSSTDRGGVDLTEDSSAYIHGVGMNAIDGDELARSGTAIVWSPRTNISLYGNTAPVTMYHAQGVLLGLGTDWTPSGSIHMLRELQCAAYFNDNHLGGYFKDRELWLMATTWSAEALAIDDVVGSLEPELIADIAIYDGGDGADYYRALIDAGVEDCVLVLRGGLPLYGDGSIMAAIPGGQTGCEAIPGGVCGVAKTACIERETSGDAYSALEAANTSAYGLFYCDMPEGEPSCVPSRPDEYTGEITVGDRDGDGIVNDDDNCPDVFNPVRPLDNGVQADNDGDEVGDVCDPCPLDPDTSMCTETDPDDRDRDGTANDEDNCPYHFNPGQEDDDDDDKGDACDACPEFYNPGARFCPASIYDIKAGLIAEGGEVSISGVVTAVVSTQFWVQVPEGEHDVVLGYAYSGIFVYVPESNPEGLTLPGQGDSVVVSGSVDVFWDQIQLSYVNDVEITASGLDLPAPAVKGTDEICTGCADAAAYEGVLVKVEDGEVTQLNPPAGSGDTDPTNEYVLDGTLRINDYIYLTDPFPLVEEILDVTGVLRHANDHDKIEPRDADDVVYLSMGDPSIRAFGPSPVFVDEGTTDVETSPALVVELYRAAPGGGVEISLESSNTDNLTVPSSVIIPEGEISASVLVSGILGADDPIQVTATLGEDSPVVDVVVIAEGRVPAPIDIDPPSGTVAVDNTLDLTVTLDIPALAGGTTADIDVSHPTRLSAPAELNFPEGDRTAMFTVTGLLAEGTATVTVSTTAGFVDADIEVIELAGTPIFSEYVEGSSYNKAVEIYNGSPDALDLSTCAVNRYSNGTSTPTAIGLDAGSLEPGDTYVLCHSSFSEPAYCDQLSGSLSHNGNDAIELVCDGTTLDVFGQIGFDPGSAWGSGDVSTVDHTLRRKCDVIVGDAAGGDAFDPAVEWNGFPNDTLDGLGQHCP